MASHSSPGSPPQPPPSLMIIHPPSTPSPSSKRMRFLPAANDSDSCSIISKSTCFHCKNQGHWVRDCPFKTPPPNPTTATTPPPPFPNAGGLPSDIECNKGHGPCTAKLARSGRIYYACPLNGSKCSFFKWHDQLSKTKNGTGGEGGGASPSPSDYPMCSCGAGRCQLMTETSQPNAGRSYFACPIAKGHGACPFFLWYDGQTNTELTGHADDSRHDESLNSPLNGLQAIKTLKYDLDEYDELIFEHPNSMTFDSAEMDNPQPSPTFNLVPFGPSDEEEETVLGTEEHDDTSDRETPTNRSNLQVLLREHPHDPVLQQGDLFDPLMDKAPQVSQKASLQTDNHHQLIQYWRQSSASADTLIGGKDLQMLGFHILGWFGRLAFTPSGCLTVPPSKPVFCCVFPSFDPIPIPKKRYESHGEGLIGLPYSPPHEQFHSSRQRPSQDDDQPLSGVLFELSGVKSLLGPLQDSSVTGTIVGALEQAALPIQNMLFTLLESMDPLEHKSMTRAADCTFAALDLLSVNYRPFYERVTKFIGRALSLAAEIDRSIENDLSSQELIKQHHNERDRFDDFSRAHADVVGKLTTCDGRQQLLRKEVSWHRETLLEKEKQLLVSEAEGSELQTRESEISKAMIEGKESVQAAAQKAQAALELCGEREVSRCAAEAAFEEARAELRLL